MALFDRRPHPLHDRGEVNFLDFRRDAKFFRFPDLNDSIRRIDENFRGDSAGVQARASHGSFVHERDGLLVLQRIFDNIRTRPGADDDDVVFFHDFTSSRL